MVETSSTNLERQLKQCGHYCFPSTTPKCCPCSDLRPVLDGDKYPIYIDGIGWRDEGSRDAGYCPVCNPKNYDEWIEKIELNRIEKKAKLEERLKIEKQKNAEILQDILTISETLGDGSGSFTYTNGDQYTGEFYGGLRHGKGTMLYASDNSCYEGEFQFNMQHGFGIKNWGDGIVYIGEWIEDKMHGKGKYTLSCGTIIEGLFENDEFVE